MRILSVPWLDVNAAWILLVGGLLLIYWELCRPGTILPGAMGGVWEWENAYHIRSSRWAISDYNSETPSTKLNVQKNTINPVLGKRKYEIFD